MLVPFKLFMYVCVTNFNVKQMKLRITLFTSLLILLSICFTGCKQELKDFSFSYSMESVDSYKLLVQFNSDKTFRLEEYNFYMDNIANKRDPKIIDGKLTDEEFNTLKGLLENCDFFGMEDSYGFDKEANPIFSEIMYQISFSTGGKEKYISIRNSNMREFSSSFIDVIDYIKSFLNSHKNG